MIAAIASHLTSWGVPYTIDGERVHIAGANVEVTDSPRGEIALTSGGVLTVDPMVAAATIASPIARSLYIHLHDADH